MCVHNKVGNFSRLNAFMNPIMLEKKSKKIRCELSVSVLKDIELDGTLRKYLKISYGALKTNTIVESETAFSAGGLINMKIQTRL